MYDVVLIDAPPLLPVTDAAVVSTAADGAILVVRHGKTKREQVKRALESLAAVDARLLGAVLNMAPTKGPDAYYYGYGYRYTHHEGRPSTTPAAAPKSKVTIVDEPYRGTSVPANGTPGDGHPRASATDLPTTANLRD
jgi:non-specific protein-tyrosine kinase